MQEPLVPWRRRLLWLLMLPSVAYSLLRNSTVETTTARLSTLTPATTPTPTQGDSNDAHSTGLKAKLLRNYERTSPPDLQKGVVVRNQLYLEQLVEVNTPLQTWTIQYWSRSYWKDERLSWNISEWPGISDLTFTQDELWHPDEFIYETVSFSQAPTRIVVNPDGSAFQSQQRVSTIGCRMQLKNFPFDRQQCVMTVGSLGYSQNVMDLQPRISAAEWNTSNGSTIEYEYSPIDFSFFRQNAEFIITNIRVDALSTLYQCCPNPFPTLQYTITFRRSSLTYVSGIILPLMIITLVSHFGMLMGSTSGGRTGLGITAMLTTSSIYLVASASIPKTGEWTLVGKVFIPLCLSVCPGRELGCVEGRGRV